MTKIAPHNSFYSDLSAIKILHCSRETVDLSEGSDDLAHNGSAAHMNNYVDGLALISSMNIFIGDQCTNAELSYTPYTIKVPPRRT